MLYVTNKNPTLIFVALGSW